MLLSEDLEQKIGAPCLSQHHTPTGCPKAQGAHLAFRYPLLQIPYPDLHAWVSPDPVGPTLSAFFPVSGQPF